MNPSRVHLRLGLAASFALCFFAEVALSQKPSAHSKILADFERRLEQSDLSGLDGPLMDFAVANPENPKALELLARLRFRQARLAESRALYQRVLRLNPASASAKINSARIAFASKQRDEAVQLLNGVDRTASLTPLLRSELAAAYLLVGEPRAALSVAEDLPAGAKAAAALPLLGEIYLRLNRRDAFDALIPLMRKAARKNASLAVRCAEVLRSAGAHKEAMSILTTLTPSARNNFGVLLALSRLEILTEDLASAREHLRQAAKIEPKSAEVLSLQAHAESLSGNADVALKLITRARDAAPNSPVVLADFVALTLRIGKPVLAYDAAMALAAMDPDSQEFQYLLGVAALQSGNLDPAQESLERYILSRPNDFRGCLALGMVYAGQRGQTERAQTQLARCNEIDPSNTEARYRLGLSYKSQGDNKRAIELLGEVVRLAPNHASALRDLGALHLESGDDAKARGYLERAVALIPKDGDTHFQLARLYNRLGETALAKQHQEIFQKLRGPWGKSAQ